MTATDQIIRAFEDTDEIAFVVGDRVSTDTSEFFEPLLEPFCSPHFVAPQITPQLVDTVLHERLLVLNGSQTMQKLALSRHIAWCVQQAIVQQGQAKANILPVLEWYPGSTPHNPALALQHWPYPAIFILPHVMPHHLGYDLLHLHRVASTRNHAIILVTDVPFVRWHLPETARDWWRDLATDVTYSPNDLADTLMHHLHNAAIALPGPPGQATRDTVLVGQETIRTVAVRLRTPYHSALFADLLASEQRQLSEDALLELIDLVRDEPRALKQWYLTRLNPRQQLFALGLMLFEGLFDDQLFAALEELVNQAWHQRDMSLRALDYCDLEGLRLFFNLVKSRDTRMKVESILPDQRRLLFEIAWDSYRRQLLAALPVLEHLVINATRATGASLHWHLYGTPARCDQVCRVVGETLSDIGLISIRAVHDTLLRLVANEHSATQAVAARAMARWYGYGRAQELAEMFQHWQHEQRVVDLMLTTIQEREKQTSNAEDVRASLRATLALIVGYATQYYGPGTLSNELVRGFARAAEDQHPLVRSRFRDETLSLVVPLHLAELSGVLRDMTAHIDLHTPIAQSLAQTYRFTPGVVLTTLNEWYDECVRHRPRRINQRVIALRETLLAMVVRTYGEIRYDKRPGTISAEDAFKKILTTLAEERHTFVRSIGYVALHRLLRSHFVELEIPLQQFIAIAPPREHGKIVTILIELYLEQRERQHGGDDVMEVDQRRYPVWVDTTRPMTDIEQTIYRWIKDVEHSAVQEMGMVASVAFVRALEKTERQRISQIRRQRRQEAVARSATATEAAAAAIAELEATDLVDVTAVPSHSLPSAYVEQFVPWFVTMDARQLRPVIQGLLNEALAQSTTSREAMVFVFDKWHRTSDEEMHDIARRLERALSLVESGVVLLLIVGGFLLVVLFLVVRSLLELLS